MKRLRIFGWRLLAAVAVMLGVYGIADRGLLLDSAFSSPGPVSAPQLQTGDDEIAAQPQKQDVEEFMARKLKSSQRTIEGVMTNDFQLIRDECSKMVDLSRHAAWKQLASPVYIQDTADFVAAAEFLEKMAAAEDAEGTSMAFSRLTASCANCHLHVRTPRVAQLKYNGLPEGRQLLEIARLP
ncbi:MAG: cytochrome c [Planctomyces sp.]|nr:cytochrome c [Planctomyces sp.]